MRFKNILFSALLLTSASLYADSIGWGTPPSQPIPPTHPGQSGSFDPWGNGNNNGGSINTGGFNQVRAIEETIENYFDERDSLDLLQDQLTHRQLQGLKIRDITIVASSEDGQGQAALVLNGQSIENSKIISREMSSTTFKVDPFANIADQSLRSIVLSMRGQFYVEKVIFNVFENGSPNGPGPTRPPEGPQVEVVRQQLNERIQQEGGLELFRMFNLGLERQGQTIKRVTILARSPRGMAQASLMINNQQSSSSQNIGYDSTRISFDLNRGMKIGQEIQGLRLYFRGDVSIDEVSIEIEKRSEEGNGHYPPSNERRFEQVINQRLYDTSGIDLRSLMQIPSRFDDRIVDSLELVIRNSDMGVRLKLCQVIQDRYQSVNCAAPVTVSRGAQVIRLSGVNLAKLRESQLSIRMGMVDIDRIAINFR